MSLFHLANGCDVKTITAKDLIKIPVWRNNRLLDRDHMLEIRNAIGKNIQLLDHGYQIAILVEQDAAGNDIEQKYIIDGQHRLQVIKHYFEEEIICAVDFPILVYERLFDTERELIEHFNAINKCKPLKPMEDENLTLNAYIHALQKVFPGPNKRCPLLRPGLTHRPYLSTDRLRDVLRTHIHQLPKTEQDILEFAKRSQQYNEKLIKNDVWILGIDNNKRREFFERGQKCGFILAYDERLPWIAEILHDMKK